MRIRAIVWAVFVTALDQLSKFFATQLLQLHQPMPVIDGFFRLTLTKNPGGAFGILSDNGSFITLITATVGIAILGVLLFAELRSSYIKAGLILIAGGAFGNLIDRLRWGYVIDFLDFRVWPVFNFADTAIVLGTALVILTLFSREARQ